MHILREYENIRLDEYIFRYLYVSPMKHKYYL